MLFVYSLGHSQVGIVTNNPDKNSILDLTGFNNKGLNLPKVALTSTTSPSPLTSHVAGMMVYNTNTSGSGNAAVTPGVYFNDGTKWGAVAVAASSGGATSLGWKNFFAPPYPLGAFADGSVDFRMTLAPGIYHLADSFSTSPGAPGVRVEGGNYRNIGSSGFIEVTNTLTVHVIGANPSTGWTVLKSGGWYETIKLY